MILITGASKGIGYYLLEKYFNRKEKVYGTYNSTQPVGLIELFSKVDISDYEEVRCWVEKHLVEKEEITLINCAGISYNSFAHKADINRWREVLEVNIIGTFNVIRCLLPFMREIGFGRIINFSSVVAQKPTPGTSAYAASKSALWGLSRSLAIENASKGITVNNINLGYSNIGMGINEVSADFQKELLKIIPAKQFCNPKDIFNTVEYLRNTSYINGSSIDINGGLV